MFCLFNGSHMSITFFWRDRLGTVETLGPLEALETEVMMDASQPC